MEVAEHEVRLAAWGFRGKGQARCAARTKMDRVAVPATGHVGLGSDEEGHRAGVDGEDPAVPLARDLVSQFRVGQVVGLPGLGRMDVAGPRAVRSLPAEGQDLLLA